MQDWLQAIVFFTTKKRETKEKAIGENATKGKLKAMGHTGTVSPVLKSLDTAQ